MQGSALGFQEQCEMQPLTGGEPLPSTTSAIRVSGAVRDGGSGGKK